MSKWRHAGIVSGFVPSNSTNICTWSCWFFHNMQSALLCTIEHLFFEFSDLKLRRGQGCTCAAYATFSLMHGNSMHAVNKNCCVEYMRCWKNCIPRFMSLVVIWTNSLTHFQAKRVQLIKNVSESTIYIDIHQWLSLMMNTQHVLQVYSKSESFGLNIMYCTRLAQNSETPVCRGFGLGVIANCPRKAEWGWRMRHVLFGRFLMGESWQGIVSAWFRQNLLFLNMNICFYSLWCIVVVCFVGCGPAMFFFCFFSGTFGCVSAAQDARLRDQWTMSPLAKCQLQGEANAIDLAR